MADKLATNYGTRQFSGTHSGFGVSIWYVTDRDEFERK